MFKYYKYRLYPTDEQKLMFAKTFGCSRFIYNKIKGDYEATYGEEQRKFRTPASYKDEFDWLREVDCQALCNEQLHVQKAFKRFREEVFPKLKNEKDIKKKYKKRAVKAYNKNKNYQFKISDIKGYPNFHSKKNDKQSYTTNNINNNIRFVKNGIRFPKIGIVNAVLHRYCYGKLKSVTISVNSSGEYYASVLVELPDIEIQKIQEEKVCGADMSYKELTVYSDGTKAKYPKYYRKSEKKLKREQRKLSKKTFNSNNWNKQRIKVAKTHRHIANQRLDFQHNEANKLLQKYNIVVVEDINMQQLANRKRHGGKSVNDIAFGQFHRILEYKLNQIGGKLIKADKFYPSSQLCHVCGYKNTETKDLSIRKWTCPNCHTQHDRDVNAAINLKNYYSTIATMEGAIEKSIDIKACGEGVRPIMAVFDESGKVVVQDMTSSLL